MGCSWKTLALSWCKLVVARGLSMLRISTLFIITSIYHCSILLAILLREAYSLWHRLPMQ